MSLSILSKYFGLALTISELLTVSGTTIVARLIRALSVEDIAKLSFAQTYNRLSLCCSLCIERASRYETNESLASVKES